MKQSRCPNLPDVRVLPDLTLITPTVPGGHMTMYSVPVRSHIINLLAS